MPPFVDRPDHLTRFLETVFEKLWMYNGDIKPPKEQEYNSIWNTRLELYLKKFNKESRQKALTLLKDESVDYGTKQALVLCQLKQSDEGIVYLYQKTGHVYGYFTLLDEKESTEQVIQGVREYGPKGASLYPILLSYFSSSPEDLAKSRQELLSVMKHIDEKGLLSPIQVFQVLYDLL